MVGDLVSLGPHASSSHVHTARSAFDGFDGMVLESETNCPRGHTRAHKEGPLS
jgi:hypothetical protein